MTLLRILVPLDGSLLAARILPRVAPLARQPGVVVRLLGIRTGDAADSDALERHLEHFASTWRTDGFAAEAACVAGEPSAEILRLADAWPADLLAMSTHGRSGLGRLLLGSVAERVLRASRAPVLLANPAALAPGPVPAPRRILVPLDLGPCSSEILPLAGTLARTFGATVVLFRVAPPGRRPVRDRHTDSTALPDPADVATGLEPFRGSLAASGVQAVVRAAVGDAAAAILDAVRTEGADLVACTTHGRSGPARLAFGSVAEQVLRACPVPLLVKRVAEPAG